MKIMNQLFLKISFAYFFHHATLSSPQWENVDEEAPSPKAFDPEEPTLPPQGQELNSELDPRFVSTSTSTIAVARTGIISLPRAECPIPDAIRQGEPSVSDANAGEELRLHVMETASEEQNCQLFQHSTIPTTRLRIKWNSGLAQSSEDPMLHSHAIDIEFPAAGGSEQSVPPPVYLGETFLSLTYQAVVALVVFHFQNTDNGNKNSSFTAKPPSGLLMASEVAVMVGFAASLIGVLLRQTYLNLATNVEKAGSVSAAIGFFLMMAMLSTSRSQWIGGICGGASLLAFAMPLVKMIRERKL